MVCAKIDMILAAMTASCMSPKEIAQKSGVSVNIVYRMRRGYLVKMECFGKICRALEIEPANVLDYERMKKLDKKSE